MIMAKAMEDYNGINADVAPAMAIVGGIDFSSFTLEQRMEHAGKVCADMYYQN